MIQKKMDCSWNKDRAKNIKSNHKNQPKANIM